MEWFTEIVSTRLRCLLFTKGAPEMLKAPWLSFTVRQVWVIKGRSVVGIYLAFVVCLELAKLCMPLVNQIAHLSTVQ